MGALEQRHPQLKCITPCVQECWTCGMQICSFCGRRRHYKGEPRFRAAAPPTVRGC